MAIYTFLSPYLCHYRKVFSPQFALLSLIEKWEKILCDKGFPGAVLTDLFNTLDTMDHDLVIA